MDGLSDQHETERGGLYGLGMEEEDWVVRGVDSYLTSVVEGCYCDGLR